MKASTQRLLWLILIFILSIAREIITLTLNAAETSHTIVYKSHFTVPHFLTDLPASNIGAMKVLTLGIFLFIIWYSGLRLLRTLSLNQMMVGKLNNSYVIGISAAALLYVMSELLSSFQEAKHISLSILQFLQSPLPILVILALRKVLSPPLHQC